MLFGEPGFLEAGPIPGLALGAHCVNTCAQAIRAKASEHVRGLVLQVAFYYSPGSSSGSILLSICCLTAKGSLQGKSLGKSQKIQKRLAPPAGFKDSSKDLLSVRSI